MGENIQNYKMFNIRLNTLHMLLILCGLVLAKEDAILQDELVHIN